MLKYEELLRRVLEKGESRTKERTGNGTRSLFGESFDHSHIDEGFPILAGKQVPFKLVVAELLWFLRGETNVKYLIENGVNFWNDDAIRFNVKRWGMAPLRDFSPELADLWIDKKSNEAHSKIVDESLTAEIHRIFNDLVLNDKNFAQTFGDLGPIYGHQLNTPESQWVANIRNIITNPQGRRHIMTTWNKHDTDLMGLPPCHGLVTQFYVGDRGLSLQTYQRSADLFLGVPFNISSYGLLLEMSALATGLPANVSKTIFGDVHIYNGHEEAVRSYLSRLDNLYDKFRFGNSEMLLTEFEQNVADHIWGSGKVNLKVSDRARGLLSTIMATKNDTEAMEVVRELKPEDFSLENYVKLSRIVAPLYVG